MPTTLFTFLALIATISFSSLLLTLWIFHKTKKIHSATYKLMSDVTDIRRESSTLFSQLQALKTLEKTLDIDYLPPLRGWAGSPDFLLTVAETALNQKPDTILECSSGVSTVVLARCLQINNYGHVFSLEHDKTYAEKTAHLLEQYGLEEWATILYAPLTPSEDDTAWYDEQAIPQEVNDISLLVVDGPPAHTGPLARLPAVPRLLDRLDSEAIIILDDAARDDEKEIVEKWINLEPSFHKTYLHHEKGCVVLERNKSSK